MPGRSRIMKLFISLLMLLLAACASDRPPSGGLAESAPLQIIFSDPAPESVNVGAKSIHLTFSHEISARQLVNSVLFHPAVGNYDIAVNGREAEIILHTPLERNRTYTLTLDKNLRDYLGRTFSAPYTLSFSSGPVMESGKINGAVLNENWSPATNVVVVAYTDQREPGTGETSLLNREPDYLVQTDASGSFTFKHIKTGSYRIIAVNDRNHDLRYNYRSEETAQSSSEVVSSGQKASGDLVLRVTGMQRDSGTLVSCIPVTRGQIEISFSRPLLTSSFDPANVEIRHAQTGTRVTVTAWYSKNRSMFDRDFIFMSSELIPAEPYTINEKGKEKRAGITFFASGITPSKEQLTLTLLPENLSNPAYLDRAWPSLGKAVILNFSHPVEKSALNRAVTLAEAGAGGKIPLHFSLTTIDSRTFALKPESGFKPGLSFTVTVNTEAIGGTPAKPVTSTFRAAAKEDTGTLTGSCSASGEYVIVEARAAGSASAYRTTAQRAKNGTLHYNIPELPPGSYIVSAFAPSGKMPPEPWQAWNPGSIVPYQPAEPFGIFPGAVMVRAQWTTSAIDIAIKQ
ncbi:hypothetical protein G9409_02200 [Chlorobium sp. BLA1]|uniref:Ig-like domain-containing protein n=1 Tax=Candidatus Chlorobium masyuteum TaxID=2716876 RepID=UPI00141D89C0|nr:Ig-like domain-containing protein [Candidatus Chlorobium masyuteum]NHQ59417.1 hypothetical protein [Candidatus Chlorobium masyuteum]